MGKKYDRFHFGILNAGARVAGGGFVLVGSLFLLTAALGESERVFYAIVDILALAVGVALVVVEPTSRADVEDFIAGRPRTKRTGTYEKRK
jgi:hypothetical protein